jgi:predicted DNA binding CopG/RHH family protein
MKNIKLSKQEKDIENVIDQYVPVSGKEFNEISQAIALRKKDAVLNVRINSHDLENIKFKAKKLGLKYQTFVSELLHKVAEA